MGFLNDTDMLQSCMPVLFPVEIYLAHYDIHKEFGF